MTNLDNKKIMAANLNYYMKTTSISRAALCKQLDIPYSTFTEWCNARAYPRIDKIELLAKFFGIEKSDLIEERAAEAYLDYAEVGKIIKRARLEKKLSREKLAELADVSVSAITKWELGLVNSMRIDKAGRLAKILDLDRLTLLGFKNTVEPEKIIISADEFSPEDFLLLSQLVARLRLGGKESGEEEASDK